MESKYNITEIITQVGDIGELISILYSTRDGRDGEVITCNLKIPIPLSLSFLLQSNMKIPTIMVISTKLATTWMETRSMR